MGNEDVETPRAARNAPTWRDPKNIPKVMGYKLFVKRRSGGPVATTRVSMHPDGTFHLEWVPIADVEFWYPA
jgi:hypothetical protein